MSDADPLAKARELNRARLPKRFYKSVQVVESSGHWIIQLDGRAVRTPARRAFELADADIAAEIAAEWGAQETVIDPAEMPLTRIANTAIDGVSDTAEAVLHDIVRFAESDLVCYRAEDPEELVARQTEIWDPLLDWARQELGLSFNLAGGVMHVSQPPETLERATALLGDLDVFALSGAHVMTSLTGSLVITLAVAHGHLSPTAAWEAAHVDEDWQISQWGEDAEAMRRRQKNWQDMVAAARFVQHRLG